MPGPPPEHPKTSGTRLDEAFGFRSRKPEERLVRLAVAASPTDHGIAEARHSVAFRLAPEEK